MSIYACCWRYDNVQVQFTILSFEGDITHELMASERQRIFPTSQLPYKVQMIELTEAEGKAFDDMSDEELKHNQITEEFQVSFAERYSAKPMRFVFAPIPVKQWSVS